MTHKFDPNHQRGASCLNCLLGKFLGWLAGEGLWNLQEENPELIRDFLDSADFDHLPGKSPCQQEMAGFYAVSMMREAEGVI